MGGKSLSDRQIELPSSSSSLAGLPDIYIYIYMCVCVCVCVFYGVFALVRIF